MGILSAKNPNGGPSVILQARQQAYVLARALGFDEISWFGAAIINDDIAASAAARGYTASEVAVPAELGGAEAETVTVLSKTIKVPPD